MNIRVKLRHGAVQYVGVTNNNTSPKKVDTSADLSLGCFYCHGQRGPWAGNASRPHSSGPDECNRTCMEIIVIEAFFFHSMHRGTWTFVGSLESMFSFMPPPSTFFNVRESAQSGSVHGRLLKKHSNKMLPPGLLGS